MPDCMYCGHHYKGRIYPCPECGPEESAYDIKPQQQDDSDDWGNI